MSAYQVNKDTIDLMVSVLVDWGSRSLGHTVYTYGVPPTDPELLEQTEIGEGYNLTRGSMTEADALGRELIDANVRSLSARYSDGVEMCSYYAETYTWKRVDSDLVTVARALGAVQCYRYQACEHDTWRGSFADELSQRVTDKLVNLIADGWDYERPANAPVRISMMDIIAEQKNKGGK